MPDLQTLAFEIGTEEIPAFDLQAATKQFGGLIQKSLDDFKIPHGDIEIYSSPRRLIAIVSDVAESTEALEQDFKGPKVEIAYDQDGRPTKVAIGFAKGKGVNVDDLETRDVNGTEYVFAHISVPSKKTSTLLSGLLHDVIESISWSKSMRWSTYKELFTRPVRWIVALLGDQIIEFEYAGLTSSNKTWGHRVLAPGAHDVDCADHLLDVIRKCYVVPSEDERKKVIEKGVADYEAKYAPCNIVLPPKTLTEVINLSEYPTVMLGSFDEEFLKVPEEIIVDAMLMHQRYFPMYDNGKLTNRFIIVSNGDPECEANIVEGNERVVAARLYDAKFFYEEDLKIPLENYVEHLDEVVFQEQLGTMLDKTKRIEQLSSKLAIDASLDEFAANKIQRAAHLAKADLVTNAVIEFTSVQGVMGSYYASASGEDDDVALAIEQHYRPRFAGDDIPSNIVGKVLSIADKVDTICGLFALGQGPTGSSDPFALRRAAIGVIAILQSGVDISLEKAVSSALDIYLESGLEFNKAETQQTIADFFITRTKVILRDAGNDVGVIDSVLATGIVEPIEIINRVKSLTSAMQTQASIFDDLVVAYARADNLRDKSLGSDVDLSLFEEPELVLNDAIEEVSTKVSMALDESLYPQALEALAGLRGPIDDFFESTMIMVDDEVLRRNRLALLNRFVNVFTNIADFSLISHK